MRKNSRVMFGQLISQFHMFSYSTDEERRTCTCSTHRKLSNPINIFDTNRRCSNQPEKNVFSQLKRYLQRLKLTFTYSIQTEGEVTNQPKRKTMSSPNYRNLDSSDSISTCGSFYKMIICQRKIKTNWQASEIRIK